MTRQALNIGAAEGDNTGDHARVGGNKINLNFAELYAFLGGDTLTQTAGSVLLGNGTGALSSFASTAGRLVIGNGGSGLTDDANLTWDATGKAQTVNGSIILGETSGSATHGLIVGSGTHLVNFQGLDSGGTTFAFFGNNRTYGVGGWDSSGWYGARPGLSFQFESGDAVKLYRFPASSNSPFQIWGVNSSGPNQYNENTLISDISTLVFGIGGSSSSPFGAAAGSAYVDMVSNKPLLFGTNNTLRMAIDSTGYVQITSGKLYPATDGLAAQTAAGVLAGTGAPNNANGADGDFYLRSDGAAGACIYQRRAGAWVATGA